ncbi:MAG: 4Fe-4S binding protein [Eubacteriales bacterium]
MKKLLILSGKGGTGKTTTAGAFIHFAQAKAFADCDVDAPNLHILGQQSGSPTLGDYFGSEKATIQADTCTGCGICVEHCKFNAIRQENSKYQVDLFACEGCGVCQYVCPIGAVVLEPDLSGHTTFYCGDSVFSTAKLKMGRGNSGKLVTEVKGNLTKNATADLAIIDGSPGIGCPVIASMTGVDLVLIVAEPSRAGISDMERILKTAEIFQTKTLVCVNKWDTNPDNTAEIEEFCRVHEILFAGKIPYDKTASQAINRGESIAVTDCPARDALYEVYKKTIRFLDDK